MTNKRIRILYTIPNFNSAGSGKSVYDLVNRLDKTIFDPEICCFHSKGAFFSEIEALGVKIHIFPFTASYNPKLGFLSRVLKIRAFFKLHRFDLIHSWHWSSDISEPLAAKLAGIPYVYTKKAMGWNSKFWKWRSQLSTKIIVVNEDMKSAYFSKMLHKVEQFPLAIDVSRYQPMIAQENIKKDLGLMPNDFVIVSVANLVEVKGIEVLLDAVKALNNLKVKVLIIGDDTSNYAQDLKSRYKLEKQYQFIGKQLDVRPYLAMSNLFVIPTKDEGRREGIPNAPLEAMSMQRIVLGSNISGVRDILNVFPNLLFLAGDATELSEKINMIMSLSEEETYNLELLMRKRVVDVFAIEDFITRHQDLYQKLV